MPPPYTISDQISDSYGWYSTQDHILDAAFRVDVISRFCTTFSCYPGRNFWQQKISFVLLLFFFGNGLLPSDGQSDGLL